MTATMTTTHTLTTNRSWIRPGIERSRPSRDMAVAPIAAAALAVGMLLAMMPVLSRVPADVTAPGPLGAPQAVSQPTRPEAGQTLVAVVPTPQPAPAPAPAPSH
jgi:hypothetical protein